MAQQCEDELWLARAAGFPEPEFVYGRYQLVDGVIRPVEGVGGGFFYWPVLAPELPSALAELANADDKAVLDFVHRYGLLGLAYLLPKDEYRRRVEALEGLDHRIAEEPVEWIRAHARGIRLIMMAAYCVTNEDAETALAFVRERIHGKKVHWGLLGFRHEARELTSDIALIDDSVALNVLAMTASNVLTENLSGISRRVVVEHGIGSDGVQRPSLWSYWLAPAMVSIVYWQLANLVSEATSGVWRICPDCGAPFVAINRRQRFCPPRYGEKESRCALRYRQRLFRQRQKNGTRRGPSHRS